jgi:threonine/homoserine/homoserine lactone efflux protein
MSLFLLFVKAAGFGLAVAAPVGPMSLLCMRRTMTLGWREGLATGLGIATGDGLYAAVAALGLAGVSSFLLAHEQPLHLAAGLFLIFLGARTVLSAGAPAPDEAGQPVSWTTAFGGAVLLTLTNPPTIIMFAAIFAALAPASGFDAAAAAATVGGVFAGSLLWWCGIVGFVSAFRHALGGRTRRWIDRVAGLALAAFGTVELRRGL